MNVDIVPLDQIEVGDRLRSVDEDWVALIAASMREHGQRAPLEVRKIGRGGKFALISGAHRLAALREIEADTAVCVVLKASDLEAQLLEIDENLFRRELSPLDRSTFLATRKEVYEALHPETKHGAAPNGGKVLKLEDFAASFSEETAARLGISRQTIERSVARYRNIVADVRQKIAGTWLADSGSQLDELARLTPGQQRQVADFALQWPGVRKVSEIIRQIERRPAPKPATTLEKFLGLWRKANKQERQQIIDHLAPEFPGFEVRKEAA
jgi:ParB family transcriptional regulator, chromosome partitioning protein